MKDRRWERCECGKLLNTNNLSGWCSKCKSKKRSKGAGE